MTFLKWQKQRENKNDQLFVGLEEQKINTWSTGEF
jgi:hypothetical protein